METPSSENVARTGLNKTFENCYQNIAPLELVSNFINDELHGKLLINIIFPRNFQSLWNTKNGEHLLATNLSEGLYNLQDWF